MRRRGIRGGGTVAVAALALLVPAAAADAARYCVGAPGGVCDQTFATLPEAFVKANEAPEIDDVAIGAGTFPVGDGVSATTPVRVSGRGAAATRLTANFGDGRTVLRVEGVGSSISSLGIDMPGGTGSVGIIARGTVSDVAVTGDAMVLGATGIRALTPLVARRVFVDLGNNSVGASLRSSEGGKIEDSFLAAATGIVLGSNTEVRRTSVVGATGFAVVESFGASATISSSQAVVSGAGSTGLRATADTFGGATVAMRNTTLIGDGSANSIALRVVATTSFLLQASPANVAVSDTVARGFETSIRRTGAPGSPPSCMFCSPPAEADVSVAYSSIDLSPGKVTESGPGALTVGPGNIGAPDARFVNAGAGNFRLGAGSPLIDAGDPAALTATQSPTDRDGAPRVLGGRRDIGAFEFRPSALPPPPPEPVLEPRLRILTSSAKLTRRGRLRVRLRCLTPGARCAGRLSARSVRRVRLREGAPRRRLGLGARRYALAVGETKVVAIKVNRRARGFIARKGKLRVRLRATLAALPGEAVTRRLVVKKFTAPRR